MIITGTIASSLAGLAVSYIAGDLVGVLLGKAAIGGFGGPAAKTLKIGRLRHALYVADPTAQARKDLLSWCEEHSDEAQRHGLRPLEQTT